jgi:hypothetical protein
MSRTRQELEPRIAAGMAFNALAEAGRYSRYGLTTWSARMNRRAAVATAEGARRTGHAWSALRGTTTPAPPPRRMGGTVVVAVTAGSAAALAVRHGVTTWRACGPETAVADRLRAVLRPVRPAVQPRSASRDPDVIPETAPPSNATPSSSSPSAT